MDNRKKLSEKQELDISKLLDGKIQSNSGGTKFGGGDILTKEFLIEAKTTTKQKDSFTIKKDWIIKAGRQAYEQNKMYNAIAFRFSPYEPDYFIIDALMMRKLVKFIENND